MFFFFLLSICLFLFFILLFFLLLSIISFFILFSSCVLSISIFFSILSRILLHFFTSFLFYYHIFFLTLLFSLLSTIISPSPLFSLVIVSCLILQLSYPSILTRPSHHCLPSFHPQLGARMGVLATGCVLQWRDSTGASVLLGGLDLTVLCSSRLFAMMIRIMMEVSTGVTGVTGSLVWYMQDCLERM
ncbi:hypothetical protein E2C01_085999 [Portunus trituberculatus]|uniref:Uncharacterized protein n=1 Tax=Portunus trituberculatus TaxID=210409 RepID=A0A5B7IZL6_PORTR|nr:hypothetical protein [Portunus trituberculatus]